MALNKSCFCTVTGLKVGLEALKTKVNRERHDAFPRKFGDVNSKVFVF